MIGEKSTWILISSIRFFFNFILFLNLKHCISFAKHQNESATGGLWMSKENHVFICLLKST